jgi:hypothetical protein
MTLSTVEVNKMTLSIMKQSRIKCHGSFAVLLAVIRLNIIWLNIIRLTIIRLTGIRLNVAALSGGEDAGKDKGPMS